MMVEEPGRYVNDVRKAGADLICVHQEARVHLDRTINQIKETGAKAAVALKPGNDRSRHFPHLKEVDMFSSSVNRDSERTEVYPVHLREYQKLRGMLNEAGLTTDIEADGGVNAANVRRCSRRRCNDRCRFRGV